MFKKGQGMTSRTGIFALVIIVGLYAGHSWYFWQSIAENQSVRVAGTLILCLAGMLTGYFLSFSNERSSDFLIDMDGELRKVIWPETKPLFEPKAEAWGATYVVIITVIVMTLFIYVVDQALNVMLQRGILGVPGFFGWLYA